MLSKNQQILVDWTLMLLPTIKKDGTMIVPDNSPLSSDEVEDALRVISESDAYIEHTISVPAADGVRSILRLDDNWEVVVERMPFADEPHAPFPEGVAFYPNTEVE